MYRIKKEIYRHKQFLVPLGLIIISGSYLGPISLHCLTNTPLTSRHLYNVTINRNYLISVFKNPDIDFIMFPLGRFDSPDTRTSIFLHTTNFSKPIFMDGWYVSSYDVDGDSWGNLWFNITGDEFLPDTKYIFEIITHKLTIDNTEWPIEHSKTNITKFLVSSKYIEPDSLAINDSAWEKVKGLTGLLNKAKKLNDYVFKLIRYDSAFRDYHSENDDNEWASEVFHRKSGVCRHKAVLFVSMCRAVNIPSRVVFGYIVNQSTLELEPHAWAEILDEKNKWHPVDPTWHDFDFIHPYYFEVVYSPFQTPFFHSFSLDESEFVAEASESIGIENNDYTSQSLYSNEKINSDFFLAVTFSLIFWALLVFVIWHGSSIIVERMFGRRCSDV